MASKVSFQPMMGFYRLAGPATLNAGASAFTPQIRGVNADGEDLGLGGGADGEDDQVVHVGAGGAGLYEVA